MRQLKIYRSITNREDKSLEKYLHEIGRVELLKPGEEVLLAQRIKQGDAKALERLVSSNLRFVVSVAKQYQNQGLSLPDLINDGNLGLIKAAKKFDETRGFKFISYAVWWIRQSILSALAEQARMVRIPLNRIGSQNKIKKASVKLEQKLEREPTAEELSEEIILSRGEHFSEETIFDVISITGRSISIDQPLTESEDVTLKDIIADSQDYNSPILKMNNESFVKDIERILKTLTEKEAEVIRLLYPLDGTRALSFVEIGEKIGLTRERVRQIKDSAIRAMRHKSRIMILKMYLEK